jgi:hypothetical protein
MTKTKGDKKGRKNLKIKYFIEESKSKAFRWK